ncbi:putative vigilin-like isoform X1 [Penaeus vannamei]|uniref:Putative vigilin-like isoform X1 n=1 Tax=Penaeus vannamei TaxID=6689 RepID=A0A3R7N6Q3_PENVA|nr:putative vigilin-like isoform X1 [Penaeus vannamei]
MSYRPKPAGKAAENFGVKLVRPHAGNLVAPFLVKGKQEVAQASIQHMEACICGNRPLRMPLQIPVDLQPLLKTKQAPGIWLKMPLREDDPSESCALIGKEKDRALMLKKLADIEGQVRSSESASPDIAPAHYGKAIGKGGARISYIREKYGVRVNVPKDRESPIVVSDLSVNVRGAIMKLEELVQQDVPQQHVVLPVEILPEDIGIAIGKGRCHASKVQEGFGVKLSTHSREHPELPLVVEGPLGAAEKAVASVQLQRRRREELKGTIPVCVEPGRIGKVIGKGGFRIRHVAQRHGVTIQLPERNKPGAQILVTGFKENARATVAELELMANLKLRPEHVLVPLHIRPEEHILVLGPEGSMAAWIERNYGVQFLWPRAENMPLLLVGLTEDVSRTEAAIMKRLSGRRAH